MSLPRVCYFGAYDPAYPRNLILRRGLAMHGVEVVECRVSSKHNTRQRAEELRQKFEGVADRCDVILLSEFGQALAPVAWWLARRHSKRLVVDAFTPLYDSAVHDRGVARPRSVAAMRYWLLDWLALRLADRVIVDTAQHRDYFAQTFGISTNKIAVIPVGASREWFEIPTMTRTDLTVRVMFYGTYIPLHGVDTILHAIHELRDRDDLRFELIGHGQTYDQMQLLAGELRLRNVAFLESVTPDELRMLVAQANICLGIFGATPKAGRVVPNKVYQTLAMERPVITANTPALREMFTPGRHLIAVPPGDPRSLARAIRMLVDDPTRRANLAEAGLARMEARFDEEALGLRLLNAIVRVLE